MVEIKNLGTEQRNEKTKDLDTLSTMDIIKIMNEEDLNVVAGVKKALPQIEKVVSAMIETLSNGGRIIYAGAGTSGRTGIIDAVECGPTFSCTNEFIGLIAGGYGAIVKAVEGAEDKKELCVEDLKKNDFTSKDLFVGVAASGRTPYVIGGIEYAKSLGAKTACVCCNLNTEIGKMVDYPIEVSAGPEILTGSTRLKSGTCQKVIINMLSTATMVGMGKVYKNLMVDVMATNEKLVERCHQIVMSATDCDWQTADVALKKSNNHCKEAIVMVLLHVDLDEAKEKLAKANGWVRKAIEN
ncbi:N-acetylmuramic acid 6-phosphate etherase [uncultured Traorella sp.]|uniref:N-acetylmuramic acid 6-phosphate etherase n=1 Tax=uncultured Traorella sp. TaxID=1929048 RepID=UPI0025DA0917|nr:N-acetylmuramic acid 6-phosphate etherase [uncultured Traorella sp.]